MRLSAALAIALLWALPQGAWGIDLILQSDYPKESLKNREQGIVNYRLEIDKDGLVSRCRITKSSGFERLDSETCRLLIRRARFGPNQDAEGKIVKPTFNGRVRWQIPGQLTYPPPCMATIENPGGCALD